MPLDTPDSSDTIVTNSPPPDQTTNALTLPSDPSQSQNGSDYAPGQNTPSPTVASQPSTQPTPVVGPRNGIVSNNPDPTNKPITPVTLPATHPAVAKAGILHEIGQALAGGPRYQTTIDADGNTTRTAVPLTRGQIGMAIALEAISGSLTGLSQRGPGGSTRGAAMAFDQSQQRIQQANQQQEQQAQSDAKAKSDALAHAAQYAELNSRLILNTSQSERYGVESLKDATAQNASLLSDYNDAGALTESHVSQDSLMAGMKSGAYSATKQIAIPDGFTNINGRYEQTFSIVNSPRAKVPVSEAQLKEYADNAVPGFAAYRNPQNIPDGFEIPGAVLASANAQLLANKLMLSDVDEVRTSLAKSNDKSSQELSKQIPDLKAMLLNPQTGHTLQSALQKFQKYVSHSDQHNMDFYESLRQMAAPSKPSPLDPKKTVPNTDAPFATTIAGAFGNGDPRRGWEILKAYHDEVTPEQITSEGQAADMIASSEPGSRAYKYAQRWIASNTAQKTAVARASAEARYDAKPVPAIPATLTTPDALGFTPTIPDVKEYNKRQNSFKKQADELTKTEGTFQQFNSALDSIAHGNFTGAQSVVSLFDAIGLSATPLAGKGFRVNQNTIAEHAQARGWAGALQQKFLSAKTGDVITPDQVKDYAAIANQARVSQYVNLANQVHNAGLNADFVLPTGNQQHIDPGTARIFLILSGNNPQKARQAATAKGWSF